LVTPAGHFGPSFAIAQVVGGVVVKVYEFHEPTPPPVPHG